MNIAMVRSFVLQPKTRRWLIIGGSILGALTMMVGVAEVARGAEFVVAHPRVAHALECLFCVPFLVVGLREAFPNEPTDPTEGEDPEDDEDEDDEDDEDEDEDDEDDEDEDDEDEDAGGRGARAEQLAAPGTVLH